jgi:hypothetical protein
MIRMTVLDSLLHRMVHAVSLMLDPAEHDAVCGDLAESGESGSQALREVLNLVIRRRAARLKVWAPSMAGSRQPYGTAERAGVGLVASVAMMQSGMPAATQSAQATASPTAPKGSAYALTRDAVVQG